ncbi:F0F1 ATP synthase subunit delta [Poseidonocella sedimentorum]|uniref:ATP synthase subunit delta n=1 Tax=Poseidonocella sedimentorum TaxID=871652 RepID=A0A1I6DXX6_9RHOB|nr:F0F1 ATP synthase subunit delta [Poseidonocella sedimentorum]SFR10285.1 ATP synthase F1 subcomplex delta subunit [Poseidonocella sedimentorum]
MSEPASISSGIAARYASAAFDLASDANELPTLESDVDQLADALAESDDFRAMIASPIYSRETLDSAIAALAAKMALSGITTNTLRLMAQKRRLFVLPQFVAALREMIATSRGEITAEVTSAKALTKAQSERLAKTLKERVGKDIKIEATVDESLIGGLVVKVGSRMIDSSIRAKLNSLQNAMKEVG